MKEFVRYEGWVIPYRIRRSSYQTNSFVPSVRCMHRMLCNLRCWLRACDVEPWAGGGVVGWWGGGVVAGSRSVRGVRPRTGSKSTRALPANCGAYHSLRSEQWIRYQITEAACWFLIPLLVDVISNPLLPWLLSRCEMTPPTNSSPRRKYLADHRSSSFAARLLHLLLPQLAPCLPHPPSSSFSAPGPGSARV